MRVDRLLSILLIISDKRLITGKELAEHFEVSLRTIYRDIEKICEAGVPIASTGGKGGGYYIMENYNIDNLFLNKKEVQTLIPVVDNLNFLFGRNQKFNDMILKFKNSYENEDMNNSKLSIDMSHFSMEEELKEGLFLIDEAIEKIRLLEFDYINRRIEYSKRMVEPIRIEFFRGEWYLAGFCRVRNDYRRFKLVRMRNLRLGDEFVKKDISNEELARTFSESYDKKSIKVKLKFTERIGRQLNEYFNKDSIMFKEDGTFIVEDFFPYEEGLIKFILSFGKDCEVLSPDNLREETEDYIKEILANYRLYVSHK